MLPYLLTLSKMFSCGELSFSEIKPAIKKRIHRIKYPPAKQKPISELKQDPITNHILCEKELPAENEQQVKLYKEKYAELIIGNIHAHFPEDMLSMLGSFSIFNVEDFHSSSNTEEFKVYGNESIHILKGHYQDDENTDRYQWDDFLFEMILIRGKWFEFKRNNEQQTEIETNSHSMVTMVHC